ncbi:3-keto-disaccharide hydrolase [Dyadobacter frigoris]|uniref:DUF1080 domain-containing protein n=1 Tax=Dyadobacter frigoris TaxID=2576211 RepID=A0A4U6D5W0_9BACT|nr:DUF1080 domain-containing protein [Dyadobacter frigoris]TKT92760.1 DUF1080 domain-containing protein [Dyadobacter frigoris]GLU51661.1 hypothetical protein Dfri01_11220 [Dyadobacter frigoris]
MAGYFLPISFLFLVAFIISPEAKQKNLFNGKNFDGWEGDTVKTWRVENGTIVGGSLTEKVPHNFFLCTKRTYANFDLKVKFKLTGTEGFINTGVQFRSKRAEKPDYEMVGYQADLGDGYWASLYDESRRNKTLIAPDSMLIKKILKRGDWNQYEVKCENRHIRILLNGTETVDYTEPDQSIPQSGLIGLQIHGGGKAQVAYKDLVIEEL